MLKGTGTVVTQLEPNIFTLIVVIVFIGISIGLGIYAARKAKTAEQYFGGTKSFGPIIIALGSAAAIMSAFGFIGGPGYVYKFGFTSIWITFAAGIAFPFGYWIIGKRLRAMAEVANIATLPDIARIRFQSETVRGVLAVGILIAAIPYLSSQIKGGAKLINELLGVNEHTALIILASVLLFYTMISGMAGSIITSAFQGFTMLVGVLGVIIGYFILTKGEAMTVIQNSQHFGVKYVDGMGILAMGHLVAFFIVFFVGMLGQPAMISKMYAVKNPKDLRNAGIMSGLTYAVASLVWFLVGYGALYITAKSGAAPLASPDKAAFLFLSKMHVVIQALVMAALLAAIMSTASFFISLGTGAITRDLMISIGNEISQDRQIYWGRILTILMVLLSIAFAYIGGKMIATLGAIGWGFFASVTLPTIVLGLLWKKTSEEGVISGIVVAIIINIGFVLLDISKLYKPPFPSYVVSMAASMAITIFVSFFTSTASGENLPEEIKPIFKL